MGPSPRALTTNVVLSSSGRVGVGLLMKHETSGETAALNIGAREDICTVCLSFLERGNRSTTYVYINTNRLEQEAKVMVRD